MGGLAVQVGWSARFWMGRANGGRCPVRGARLAVFNPLGELVSLAEVVYPARHAGVCGGGCGKCMTLPQLLPTFALH